MGGVYSDYSSYQNSGRVNEQNFWNAQSPGINELIKKKIDEIKNDPRLTSTEKLLKNHELMATIIGQPNLTQEDRAAIEYSTQAQSNILDEAIKKGDIPRGRGENLIALMDTFKKSLERIDTPLMVGDEKPTIDISDLDDIKRLALVAVIAAVELVRLLGDIAKPALITALAPLLPPDASEAAINNVVKQLLSTGEATTETVIAALQQVFSNKSTGANQLGKPFGMR
jgi:hypothetical protein